MSTRRIFTVRLALAAALMLPAAAVSGDAANKAERRKTLRTGIEYPIPNIDWSIRLPKTYALNERWSDPKIGNLYFKTRRPPAGHPPGQEHNRFELVLENFHQDKGHIPCAKLRECGLGERGPLKKVRHFGMEAAEWTCTRRNKTGSVSDLHFLVQRGEGDRCLHLHTNFSNASQARSLGRDFAAIRDSLAPAEAAR